MDSTPNLSLPYIFAAQSQKHVTHNEAIRALDAIVQLSVLDRSLTAPPASPAAGERHIVATGATGIWAGHADHIAAFQDNVWLFYPPRTGWLAWVASEGQLYVWTGMAWVQARGELNPVALVGINATADTTNRLTVAAPATLFNHAGGGHQVKVNKAATAQTASHLFQNAYSGRAEIGLSGDDDLHFKVSPDGSTWREAFVIRAATGTPRLTPMPKSQLPAAASAGAGALAFVPDEVGGAALAYSDGSQWRRSTDRAVVA